MKVLFLSLTLTINFFLVLAQNEPSKFGEVSVAELVSKNYSQDSSAIAVILFDIGQSDFNASLSNPLVYKRHTRIKILKKQAFDEWANEQLYVERGSLSKLKGVTYNLENGNIVKSEMEEGSIFKTRFNKYMDAIKFTLPNVKEGSIIEYSYVIKGDGLPPWQFQHSIPTRWSEYTVVTASDYRTHMRGLLPITTHEKKEKYERWVIANAPAFKPEPLMPNEDDYLSQIDFSSSRSSWSGINIGMNADENFGRIIEGSFFLKDQVNQVMTDITDPEQKIKAISNHVKKNITWNGTKDIYSEELKSVFQNKTGTAADINLALASMLDKSGIRVETVLLSTKGNGFPRMDVPTRRQFNYVICLAYIDTVGILLDATEKYLPWNVLPERCLNGTGFVVSRTNSGWVEIRSKTKAKTIVTADLAVSTEGNLSGQLTFSREGYAALEMRKAFFDKGEKAYLEESSKKNSWEIHKSEFQNMEEVEKPAKEIYTITAKEHATVAGDLIYIDPFVVLKEKENFFKLNTRIYPIDFETLVERTYLGTLTIPEGYMIEEVPKAKLMTLPGNAARFSFNVSQLNNRISIVSTIQINQTLFMPEEYANLRELYDRIIAKQSEQIVLKKKQ